MRKLLGYQFIAAIVLVTAFLLLLNGCGTSSDNNTPSIAPAATVSSTDNDSIDELAAGDQVVLTFTTEGGEVATTDEPVITVSTSPDAADISYDSDNGDNTCTITKGTDSCTVTATIGSDTEEGSYSFEFSANNADLTSSSIAFGVASSFGNLRSFAHAITTTVKAITIINASSSDEDVTATLSTNSGFEVYTGSESWCDSTLCPTPLNGSLCSASTTGSANTIGAKQRCVLYVHGDNDVAVGSSSSMTVDLADGENNAVDYSLNNYGTLFAAGLFTASGSRSTPSVAYYNTEGTITGWKPLSTGFPSGLPATAMTFDGKGRIYVGIGSASFVEESYAAYMNKVGDGWTTIGSATSPYADSLVYDDQNNTLYLGTFANGGNNNLVFSTVNPAETDNPAWQTVADGLNGQTLNAFVLDSTNNILYAGGSFTQNEAGTSSLNTVAYLDLSSSSNTWQSVGQYPTSNLPGQVYTLLLNDGTLYELAQGNVSSFINAPATTTSDWTLMTGLGSDQNLWRSMIFYNNVYYVAGGINPSAAIYSSSDPTNGFSLYSDDFDSSSGAIHSLAIDNSNGYLYVGGRFSTDSSGNELNNIAYIDTNDSSSGMQSINSGSNIGLNNTVDAIKINNILYISKTTS